jgi:hypothetical protein
MERFVNDIKEAGFFFTRKQRFVEYFNIFSDCFIHISEHYQTEVEGEGNRFTLRPLVDAKATVSDHGYIISLLISHMKEKLCVLKLRGRAVRKLGFYLLM